MAESLHMCTVPAVAAVFGQSILSITITALDMVSIAIYESDHHDHCKTSLLEIKGAGILGYH